MQPARLPKLLTQNSELRADGIFNWTLPAFAVTLSDGRNFNVCPNAGACAQLCYARNGTYLFKNVRSKHIWNLEFVLNDLDGWSEAMRNELRSKRFRPTREPRTVAGLASDSPLDLWAAVWLYKGGKAVRIHDSGDFFSKEYALEWIDIAYEFPDILFYAYTKEVLMFRDIKANYLIPDNFRWLYSLGGKQDHLLDLETERHAEVFPTEEEIEAAGYKSQDASDLLAILLPTTRVGIPANNIRHFKKKMGTETFGSIQHERDHKRLTKLGHHVH